MSDSIAHIALVVIIAFISFNIGHKLSENEANAPTYSVVCYFPVGIGSDIATEFEVDDRALTYTNVDGVETVIMNSQCMIAKLPTVGVSNE